ncbi:MAG: ABC transporter substrate-binding protein [Bacteroidales bacterium]|nr:ABC transporter substrate-binding protein [Bacteroidales bacterium]MDD3910600.1 ABC transporter substrate-binding protein [Bacteroidales bacterium]
MKHYKKFAALCAVALASFTVSFSAASYAQTPITISKEIVKVNGKLMYAHGVKKQETLYSISKAYKITIEELQKYNPALAEGLKEGTLLYIPVNPEQQVSERGDQNSAKYTQSSKPDQQAVNKENIKTAVPAENTKEENKKGEAVGNNKYIVHEVKWYEDLDDIAKEYHMDRSVLIKENNIKDETLKGVQTLRIPVSAINSKSDNSTQNTNTEKNAPVKKLQENKVSDSNAYSQTKQVAEPVKVAVILPLNSKSAKPNTNYMDFYAGALLAINDLKEAGADIAVNAIDQSEYASSQAIINSGKLTGCNLIIGPIRSTSVKSFIPYINKHGIPLVSPLDPATDSLINKSKYLFQVPPTTDIQFHNLVIMAKKEYEMSPNKNVVVVFQNGGNDRWAADEIMQLLKKEGIAFSEITYSILQGRTIGSTFKRKITADKDNIVFVPSFNEAFVSDVLRNLDILEMPEKISLYGTPRWRSFEAVDVAQFNKFGLKLSMPFYVDFTNADVQSFTRQFRALYNTEPSANAFNGYDVTKFFTKQIINGLKNDINNTERLEKENMLQQQFEFRRKNSNAGFENISTTGITYKSDYTIVAD